MKELIDQATDGNSEVRVNISRRRIKLPPNIMVFQVAALLASTKLSDSANRVFLLLLGLSAYENFIGIDVMTITEYLDMNKRTVMRATKELETNGIITKTKSLHDKRRNDYRINPLAAWKGNSASRKKLLSALPDPAQLSLFEGEVTSDRDLIGKDPSKLLE